jgi:hypothetical protein
MNLNIFVMLWTQPTEEHGAVWKLRDDENATVQIANDDSTEVIARDFKSGWMPHVAVREAYPFPYHRAITEWPIEKRIRRKNTLVVEQL